jgi:hypothetical protein
VTEIRSEHAPAFPGLALFQWDMDEINRLPLSWVDPLPLEDWFAFLDDRFLLCVLSAGSASTAVST